MIKRICAIGPLMAILFGCNNKPAHYEYKDENITVKVMKIDNPADTGETVFTARIIPGKLAAQVSDSLKLKMIYNMDSCFYLQSGKKTSYPTIIQPVANGLSGMFEYMVSFDNNAASTPGVEIIYQDKHLNHRKYILTPVKD
jgi:hypothetical protein